MDKDTRGFWPVVLLATIFPVSAFVAAFITDVLLGIRGENFSRVCAAVWISVVIVMVAIELRVMPKAPRERMIGKLQGRGYEHQRVSGHREPKFPRTGYHCQYCGREAGLGGSDLIALSQLAQRAGDVSKVAVAALIVSCPNCNNSTCGLCAREGNTYRCPNCGHDLSPTFRQAEL